jgi:hypothetical protein
VPRPTREAVLEPTREVVRRHRLTQPDGTPGADVEILSFLDDHSRYALSVTCHQPVTGPAVVAVFRRTVADQGIPASVLSDNGMVFTTRFAGGPAGRDTLNGFQALLRDLGVVNRPGFGEVLYRRMKHAEAVSSRVPAARVAAVG